MVDGDRFPTQRDGRAVAAELGAAGLADALEIGRGGFGIVYRCRQPDLDRTVAVKVLIDVGDGNRERFLREERAMGRLTGHRHIMSVLQVGQTDSGYPYLVMPYFAAGSLDVRIRRHGAMTVGDALELGEKLAGALAAAHQMGILHRDIKPGNVLYSDDGEPVLSDWGIARIAGGFQTATGTFTGSPAFTAPEILGGNVPSHASDIYALGASLFCALTAHVPFERRSGEQVVAQFLRIATEPAPDLRVSGIPDDVASLIESAMSRRPEQRPAADAFRDMLRAARIRRGRAGTAALPTSESSHPDRPQLSGLAGRTLGSLPPELTSFVGRRAELAKVRDLLARSRLVTLTGVGGVGKTRLALRAAAKASRRFADGVRVVELSELHDASMLVYAIAAGLGLREDLVRSQQDVLVEFLSCRKLLLVMDNCEQVVDAAAKLAEWLLSACPDLRMLITSRERLGVAGESILRLSPLGSDAVDLFAARAAQSVPGFRVSEGNRSTVAAICSKVDGLSLGIELAAARLRAMSPEQLLQRLHNRYALLSNATRGAPQRQQTLGYSIGWSYDLCTPSEQRVWSHLSVFAGSFVLEAAEYICAADLSTEAFDDILTALVDKSVVIRTEAEGSVRFRLIDTLRHYGLDRIEDVAEFHELRMRHLYWYRSWAGQAAADFFGPRQLDWIRFVEAEIHNFREAAEFALTVPGGDPLELIVALQWYGIAHGTFNETRRALEQGLAAVPQEPTIVRVKALHALAMIAGGQGDITTAAGCATEARGLAAQLADPVANGLASIAEGFAAVLNSQLDIAAAHLDDAIAASDDPIVQISAMMLRGWVLQAHGDTGRALVWQEKALAIAVSAGETAFQSYGLWSIGIGWWRHGNVDRAEQLLQQGIQLAQLVDDARQCAALLEALGWIANARGNPHRAAVLLGAAEHLGRSSGVSPSPLPDLAAFHDECEQSACEALGATAFHSAWLEGSAFGLDESVRYALDADPGTR
ncbi:protein kinase [Mycobacterium dioxanotrophicus]|uniref:Protein kinase n=2 Tax=Mycobacterium dioxanotrophicus TaxID=482462 RepID=A0A1Y0CCL4_9MYCO|nr:protein kinase [Mycobacterium dioxanotrophicus]